jgi:hypothetical protein
MPVYRLHCPDCGHGFRSLVMAGARVPPVWVCSQCGSRRAEPVGDEPSTHPLAGDGEGASGACPCCG